MLAPWLILLVLGSGDTNQPRLAELGARLFADPRLSVDKRVACASCHVPELGFVDGQTASTGVGGRRGVRNAPTLLNAALQSVFFWDGRAATLEEQALGPLLNAKEMGQPDGEAVAAAVRADPAYTAAMTEAFGASWGVAEVVRAIASYERTLLYRDAPFDAFIQGDTHAISPEAQTGWMLFNGKGRCNQCHALDGATRLFTDQQFHNVGIGSGSEDGYVPLAQRTSHLGRFLITGHPEDRGAFKTPDLRNVGISAPYMHDGSLVTLWDVMDHYNRGGDPNPRLDSLMRRLSLTESEIDALVAFMFTLTDTRLQALHERSHAAQTARKNRRPERETL